MPTNKQRREAAQRRLQRQLERRAQQARKRRRTLLVLVAAAAVLVVVGAAALITSIAGGDDESADAAATSSAPSSSAPASSAAAPTTNADGTVSCNYVPDDSGNPNLTDVGTPPSPEATPAQGTTALLMTTGQGDLTLTLDRAAAPCAAASFTHLAQQGFFDGSPCHREVNQESFGVLQCGDPSGTGQGGPSYKYGQEVTAATTYPRGTIAMANTGAPDSTGSQFFLCFTDTMLDPDYTAVGTVDEAGLAVLDQIAAAGNDGAFEPAPGGGAPNTPVTIESMTVLS